MCKDFVEATLVGLVEDPVAAAACKQQLLVNQGRMSLEQIGLAVEVSKLTNNAIYEHTDISCKPGPVGGKV